MTSQPNRPSRITVPERAHPHARLVFQLMKEGCVTYDLLEYKAGILRSTVKAWRQQNVPSLQSIEAALGVFGWTLVPVPPLSSLKQETLDAIEEISLDFVSDHAALAAVMARVCRVPVQSPSNEAVTVQAAIEATVRVRRPKVIEGQTALQLENVA